jgi:DNA-binding transcriptional LysR family regulator
MNLLNAMSTFVRVVETGSFTAVAREQGSLQPAISKQIAWLESHLGNRLIERTTRRLLFTEQALAYYESCKLILDAVRDAEKQASNAQVAISGDIRVSASVGLGSFQIAPHLPEFVARYPGTRVDLRLSDTYVDVVGDGIDIAFRLGQSGDASLVSRRLGFVRPILVASAAYVKARGRPETLSDVTHHDCVVISARESTSSWRFENADMQPLSRNGPLCTDSGVGARALVLAGAGIALLPKWLVTRELQSGEVEHLLPNASAVAVGLYAITPQSRRHSAKVAAFLDYFAGVLMRGGAVE